MTYDPPATAILLVDPYNDFLSEGGKLWPRVKAVAEEVRLLDHLREVISTARTQELKIIFVPPPPSARRRWAPPTPSTVRPLPTPSSRRAS
jgi:nicotinamidase-related amidase